MSQVKTDADHAEWILEHFKNGLIKVEFDPKKPDIDFGRYGQMVYGYLLDIDPKETHLYGDVPEWDFDKEQFNIVPNKLKRLKLTMRGIPQKFRIADPMLEAKIEQEISTRGFHPHDMVDIRYVKNLDS